MKSIYARSFHWTLWVNGSITNTVYNCIRFLTGLNIFRVVVFLPQDNTVRNSPDDDFSKF